MTDVVNSESHPNAARYVVIGTVAGGLLSLVGSFLGTVYTNEARLHEVNVQLAAQEKRDDLRTKTTAYVAFVTEASQLRDELNDLITAIELEDQASYTKERSEVEAARFRTYTAAATIYMVGDRSTNRAAVAFTEAAGKEGQALEVENADASALRKAVDDADLALGEFLDAADADTPELASPSPAPSP